jgi:hypothetical protein
LEQLKIKLQHATDEKDILGYQSRLCEMAAICRATYDVGHCHLDLVLSSANEAITLITSSVCLYDNQPPDIKNAPKSLQVILCRDRRFAHKVTPYMLKYIRHNIFSTALCRIWPDYRPGSDALHVYSAPNNRWIATTTMESKDSRKQQVHLNVVTGQLLIDGKPLGRLPRRYVEHETYIRLFGQVCYTQLCM